MSRPTKNPASRPLPRHPQVNSVKKDLRNYAELLTAAVATVRIGDGLQGQLRDHFETGFSCGRPFPVEYDSRNTCLHELLSSLTEAIVLLLSPPTNSQQNWTLYLYKVSLACICHFNPPPLKTTPHPHSSKHSHYMACQNIYWEYLLKIRRGGGGAFNLRGRDYLVGGVQLLARRRHRPCCLVTIISL